EGKLDLEFAQRHARTKIAGRQTFVCDRVGNDFALRLDRREILHPVLNVLFRRGVETDDDDLDVSRLLAARVDVDDIKQAGIRGKQWQIVRVVVAPDKPQRELAGLPVNILDSANMIDDNRNEVLDVLLPEPRDAETEVLVTELIRASD